MKEYRVTVEFTVQERNLLDSVDTAHYLVWQGLRSAGRESDIRVVGVQEAGQ